MTFSKEDIVGFQIKRLNSIFSRRVENLPILTNLKEQLGMNAFILIYLVDHINDIVYQNDLANRFSVTKGTLSKILSNLELKEYIERAEIDGDKRKKRIIPTKKAIEITNDIQTEIAQVNEEITKDFTNEEKYKFIEFIKRAISNIKEKR